MSNRQHQSGNSNRHPYQRADKVNRWWHDHEGGRLWTYSQETKDELDRQANEFILENSNAKRTNWIKA